ncbi:hypothetical protein [Priestia filamentosa]|nr:hypothetical protein [Priestia filamentosa]
MNKEEKEIVKYDDKWWMLEKVSDNNMATIWRNGQSAIVSITEVVRKSK